MQEEEAIHIRRHGLTLNGGGGYELSVIFNHLLSRDLFT